MAVSSSFSSCSIVRTGRRPEPILSASDPHSLYFFNIFDTVWRLFWMPSQQRSQTMAVILLAKDESEIILTKIM